MLDEIITGEKWNEKFLIAEGLNPIPGDDAVMEFNFKTDMSAKPQVGEDGHVDFHEISLVNSIEKDKVLIKIIPATLGKMGTDIFGGNVLTSYGKDAKISLGPGTYKDPADNFLIKSSIDGVIFYNDEKKSIVTGITSAAFAGIGSIAGCRADNE